MFIIFLGLNTILVLLFLLTHKNVPTILKSLSLSFSHIFGLKSGDIIYFK